MNLPEIHQDLLYLIPGSTPFSFAWGFLKSGVPYVVRLVQLSPKETNDVWELKISKLKYSKDLKEYGLDQEALDPSSQADYLKIVDAIFEIIPSSTKIKIKGLLFNLPQNTSNHIIETLKTKFFKIIKHRSPLLRHPLTPTYNEKFNWIFFTQFNPVYNDSNEKLFIEKSNSFLSELVDAIPGNVKKFHPKIPLKPILDHSAFPEIDNKSDVSLVYNLEKIQKKLPIKFNNKIFKDLLKQKSVINLFAEYDTLDSMLEKSSFFSEKEVENILDIKKFVDTIISTLNYTVYNILEELNTLIAEDKLESNYDSLSEEMNTFIHYCILLHINIYKHPNFLKHIKINPFISNDKIEVNKNSKLVIFIKQLDKIQKLLEDLNVRDFRMEKEINYSLPEKVFSELASQEFNRYVISNSTFIKKAKATKEIFDVILNKLFNKDSFEKSFDYVATMFDIHVDELKGIEGLPPTFFDWFVYYNKIKNSYTHLDLENTFNFDETTYLFTFYKPTYDFFGEYGRNKTVEEHRVFDFLFDELCKQFKLDKNEIIINKDYSGLATLPKNFETKFKPVYEEERIDPKTTVYFCKWIKEFLKIHETNSFIKETPLDTNIKTIISQSKITSDELSEYYKEKNKILILKNKAISNPNSSIKYISESEDFKESIKNYKHFILSSHNKKLKAQFATIWKNRDFRHSINEYTESSQIDNDFFRKNEKYDDYTKLSVLSKVKVFFSLSVKGLPKDTMTYRGSHSDKWLKDKIAGEYVIEPGFLSTSINSSTIDKFGNDTGIGYIFYLPKGTRGLYLEEITHVNEEYEFLLPPGSVFKIIGIENRKNAKYPQKGVIGDRGVIYSLLLVGSITTEICNKKFEDLTDWNEFKETLKESK